MNFLPFLIAKRLYFTKSKKYKVSCISTLSKISISISCFALIMSFSALNGFTILLNQTIFSTLPHGIIQLSNTSSLTWQDVIKELKSFPGITDSEPYLVTNGLLTINNKIKLIEIKSFNDIKNFKKNLLFTYKNHNFAKNKYNNYEIILSSHLMKNLSIKKGDWINLIFLNKKNNNPYLERFALKITNIFISDGILDSNIGYVSFDFFKKFLNINRTINKVEIYMSDPFNADKIIINAAKKINTPLFLYTWINSYKYIYQDIKRIKAIIYLALLLLVMISCFSVASISLITISEKKQDIAILRSIGANNLLIQIIFLYYGLRSIIIGSSIALFIGLIITLNFKRTVFFLEKYFHKNILLDNIYYHSFLLLELNFSDIIIIFISTIIIGIITNWYPAYFASKINPSKILKEY